MISRDFPGEFSAWFQSSYAHTTIGAVLRETSGNDLCAIRAGVVNCGVWRFCQECIKGAKTLILLTFLVVNNFLKW